MLAWMFSTGQYTPAQFAKKAKSMGYEWAALEYDDRNFDPLKWYPDFRDACRANDILPGIWLTEGGNVANTPTDAAFSIAEIEGPGDYEGVVNAIKAKQLPNCPLAICTNFNTPLGGGTQDAKDAAKILIDAGFSCLTEAYMNENMNANPDSLDRYARVLGWDTSQPVFGVYPVGGKPVPSYAQWQNWPGVDYLGEYVM